ncbi:hypothetical protein [Natrinema gari]|uniref:Uncharacterized protein n=1 Tax=Natrinema gari JCM 14663 TaxID=1230459 RepID=L9ZF37_9EURY|nr:hypothetical protein [Natrinema gari]ELY85040.1 hypothetical protein C486_00350 [Natrinema gari JCM 14663]
MKFININSGTIRSGIVATLTLMLAVSMIAGGAAAQIDRDSGYVANDTTVDADGPTTVDVDLTAATDPSLDTDPLEVTTYVVDGDGNVVDNQTASLNSEGTATHSYDVDRGSYDVEVVAANQTRADSMLSSSSFTTTEDRNSAAEVTNKTVEVTGSTELIYSDLSVDSNASSNASITVDLLDENSSTVAYDTVSIAPNESGSVEFDVTEDELNLSEGNYTVEVYTTDTTTADYVTADIGTESESILAPITSGSTAGIPNWGIAAGAIVLIGGGVVYMRRRD